MNRDSIVGVATGYGLGDRGVGVRVHVVQTALGSTQPSIQWVQGSLSPGVKRPGVKVTTHLQLVRRSRKSGSIHPLPHTPSWLNA
jgi:hypothetical protein